MPLQKKTRCCRDGEFAGCCQARNDGCYDCYQNLPAGLCNACTDELRLTFLPRARNEASIFLHLDEPSLVRACNLSLFLYPESKTLLDRSRSSIELIRQANVHTVACHTMDRTQEWWAAVIDISKRSGVPQVRILQLRSAGA